GVPGHSGGRTPGKRADRASHLVGPLHTGRRERRGGGGAVHRHLPRGTGGIAGQLSGLKCVVSDRSHACQIVPTLRVVTHPVTLCVTAEGGRGASMAAFPRGALIVLHNSVFSRYFEWS